MASSEDIVDEKGKDSEVKLDILMEIAKECFADEIDPKEIVGALSFLQPGEDRMIVDSPPVEGTKKIFDLAIMRKGSQELTEILRRKYKHLHDRLLHDDILSLCRQQPTDAMHKNEENDWRMLLLFRGELYAKVDPNEIVPRLQAFLLPTESERIIEISRGSGRFNACLELVTIMARKKTAGSYVCLLTALVECGMSEVAATIDPDFSGRVTNDLSRKRKRRADGRSLSDDSNVAEADSTSQTSCREDFCEKRQVFEAEMRHLTSPLPQTATVSALQAAGNSGVAEGNTEGARVSGDASHCAGPSAELPVLRPYQQEMLEHALRGVNCVICMPTNSGKTIVAAHVIARHLSLNEKARVIFVAPQVALVDQQYNVFKKFLGHQYKMHSITGDAPEASRLLQLSKENHLLVLTPQILVNALQGVYAGEDNSPSSRLDSLGIFTLLILDECHHCKKGSPYNRMMSYYVRDKSKGFSPLPQVIGLTATLGVGRKFTDDAAVQYILEICANLACEEGPKTVQNNIESLKCYVKVPSKEQHPVTDRLPNAFSERVIAAMHRLEDIIIAQLDGTPLATLSASRPFADPLKPAYQQGVSDMEKSIKESLGGYSNKMQAASVCLNHLKVYWKALEIWQYVRNKDAYKHLTDSIQCCTTDEAKKAETLFEETKTRLEQLLDEPDYNPRLDELAKIIRIKFASAATGTDRGLIFVQTRKLTGALCKWLEELDNGAFSFLKPKPFTAKNTHVQSPAGSGGLTAGQREVLAAFRAGDTRLLVCTSVAEEGLDIPECNFCVMYLRDSNVISSIQARGRVRAANGIAHTIISEGGGAKKEELNWLREMLMDQAMTCIREMKPEVFKAKIEEFQQRAILATENAERSVAQQPGRVEESVTLLCGKCDAMAVTSADVRVLKYAHHVVTDLRFEERVTKISSAKRESMGHGMVKDRKIYCKRCNNDWGAGMTMGGCSFFMLKLDPFVVQWQDGSRTTYKKWKEFPRLLHPIQDTELMKLSLTKIDNDQ